jgi:hypothetical protein
LPKQHPSIIAIALALPLMLGVCAHAQDATTPTTSTPQAVAGLAASDHAWDGGDQIDLRWPLSPDDVLLTEAQVRAGVQSPVAYYLVQRSGEAVGHFQDVARFVPDKKAYRHGEMRVTLDKLERLEPYYFRVYAVGPGDVRSDPVRTIEPAIPTRERLDGDRVWMGLITFLLCGSVVTFIMLARRGMPMRVRTIAGLKAVDEAVGRATEMGRPVLFVTGTQDMNDIQTVAGITVLSHVARTAAEYDAKIEVPTSRSLVMTAARETVQAAFLTAGRPDAYNQDLIYYVTDEQFGFVAYLVGIIVREKPAACFYMGSFFAESLMLAETGNGIGAIQIAGTAQPAQLPFFVAACDYTLIGEEFFAASAYLSGAPEQLGSLKGQDVGKIIVALLLLVGCTLATIASLTGAPAFEDALDFLVDTVLK